MKLLKTIAAFGATFVAGVLAGAVYMAFMNLEEDDYYPEEDRECQHNHDHHCCHCGSYEHQPEDGVDVQVDVDVSDN